MLRIALTVFSSTVLVAAGAASAAGPSPRANPSTAPQVTPRPPVIPKVQKKPITLPLALTITGAKKVGGPAYSDQAALSFAVDVSNPGTVPVDARLVVTELLPTEGAPAEGAKIAEVPLKATAGGKVTVTYQLPHGPDNACTATYHRLAIAGGTSTKILKITPSCKFGVTTPNPYAGQIPDRVHEARQNKVTYTSSKLEPMQVRCHAPLYMKTQLVNNRQTDSATGVFLTLENPKGESYPSSIRYVLKPKETKAVTVEGRGFLGQAGKWNLVVHADKTEWLHQPYFAAVVTRACTIGVELTNAVPSLPRAPR